MLVTVMTEIMRLVNKLQNVMFSNTHGLHAARAR